MPSLNSTVSALKPSGIRRFFDLVLAAGPDVVSLGVGEPDFSAPWNVCESAIFALEKGFTSYTSNAGLLELREEISKTMPQASWDPKSEILITNGVSEGMDLAFRTCVNEGDVVLVPDPGYVMYEPLITLARGRVELYNPLKIREITIPQNTKGIVLNFPGNPLGNCFSKEDLQHIANLAIKHDFFIFSDEIYEALSFSAPHVSIMDIEGIKDRTLYFNGVSKSHAMTGFRIGWACGPKEIVEGMTKIHQYAALCACSLSQLATVEAMRRSQKDVKKMVTEYKKRRDYCVERLSKMPISFIPPQGAFYIFVNISKFFADDVQFCEAILKKEKLAVVPGSAFGSNGKGYFRMTYAASMEQLKEAMDRLERFLIDTH